MTCPRCKCLDADGRECDGIHPERITADVRAQFARWVDVMAPIDASKAGAS